MGNMRSEFRSSYNRVFAGCCGRSFIGDRAETGTRRGWWNPLRNAVEVTEVCPLCAGAHCGRVRGTFFQTKGRIIDRHPCALRCIGLHLSLNGILG